MTIVRVSLRAPTGPPPRLRLSFSMPIAPALITALLSLPWLLLPVMVVRRQRTAWTLDEFDATTPPNAERISVVLPARNEAEHITACLTSLMTTTWPNVEILVVNDHSTDGTRELALRAANGDPRVRVLDAPDLPTGWFGKQWACHTGSLIATGSLLLFTDADTRHAPDLLVRLVHARTARDANLISVAGRQEMQSFWEYAIQPAVFAILLARYGSTTQLERAKRPTDVIANGQCLMMTREAYDAIGGHESVRATVAEDLMLAQQTHRMGLRVSLVLGSQQLSTHMYSGLRQIVRGWMKNVYAGGRLSMWGGAAGRLLFPFALVGAPLILVAPFLVAVYCLGLAISGHSVPPSLTAWSAVNSLAMLWFFRAINSFAKTTGWRFLLVPLGALVFALICVAAVMRGQSVEWKGRKYVAE